MEIKTFNASLTEMCDYFDVLISPKKITRSNTNIIYLMFKAIAKGYEIINNVVVLLSHKFDPAYCSDEDLVSTAMLVGTEKLKGSASGLAVTLTNGGDETVTLGAGEYYYELDADTKFYFTVDDDTDINAGSTLEVIALTDKVGVYTVTQQTSISISPSLPDGLSASCQDNAYLLGSFEESDTAFRKRILSDTSRQDLIKELEMKIKNLPYIFDCSIKFNETADDITVGDITVEPYHIVIMLSGVPRPEMAELIASYGIFPTTEVESTDYVEYESSVFSSGKYKVYFAYFGDYEYTTNIIYKADENFISSEEAETKMGEYLHIAMNSNIRKDNVTENDFYNALEKLNLEGVEILSVELYVNSNRVQYISVPDDKIPRLSSVSFTEGE